MATLLELEKLEVLSKTLFKGNKKLTSDLKFIFETTAKKP